MLEKLPPESVKLPLLRDDFLISRSHTSVCSLENRRPDAKFSDFTESGFIIVARWACGRLPSTYGENAQRAGRSENVVVHRLFS